MNSDLNAQDKAFSLFEKQIREVAKQLGIKQSNYIPGGMEFYYKGYKFEIKVKVK